MFKKMLLVVLLVSILLPVSAFAYTPTAPNIKGIVLNPKISGFKTINLKKIIKSGNYKVIIVNFWATWCPPCRAEIPGLIKEYAKYSKKILILGVNVNSTPNGVVSFINNHDMLYPIVHVTYNEAMNYGGLNFIPQSFFINNEGKIVFHWQGPISRDILNEVVTKMIKIEG